MRAKAEESSRPGTEVVLKLKYREGERERVASGRRMPVSQLLEKVALAGARVH